MPKGGDRRAAAAAWFKQEVGQRSFGKYEAKKKAAKAAKPSKKR